MENGDLNSFSDEGVENVLEYMQAGGQVTCTIPAKYAYGSKGLWITSLKCFSKYERIIIS
jgi:hypothetical protein